MKLKEGSSEPDIYLGAKLKRVTLTNGVVAWSMSPSKYVQEAVQNLALKLKDNFGRAYLMPKIFSNPFVCEYAPPETDTSDSFDPDSLLLSDNN